MRRSKPVYTLELDPAVRVAYEASDPPPSELVASLARSLEDGPYEFAPARPHWWARLWRWATRQPPPLRIVWGVDFGRGEDHTTAMAIRDNGDGTYTVIEVQEITEKYDG